MHCRLLVADMCKLCCLCDRDGTILLTHEQSKTCTFQHSHLAALSLTHTRLDNAGAERSAEDPVLPPAVAAKLTAHGCKMFWPVTSLAGSVWQSRQMFLPCKVCFPDILSMHCSAAASSLRINLLVQSFLTYSTQMLPER